MSISVLGITMGDAAGIGPELILKTLARKEIYAKCNPLIIGSADVMNFYRDKFKSDLQIRTISDVKDANYEFGAIDVLDIGGVDVSKLKIGEVDPTVGTHQEDSDRWLATEPVILILQVQVKESLLEGAGRHVGRGSEIPVAVAPM